MNTVETIVVVRDQNGNVLTTYSQTQSLPSVGFDLEYEVVYNSGGSPIVRPKNAPKY